MTAVPTSPLNHPGNQQSFETCIAATLQVLASVEYGPLMCGEQPPRELLLEAASHVERHAMDLAVMGQSGRVLIQQRGRAWYETLNEQGKGALHVGYQTLHSAAFLGLRGGADTAVTLYAVGLALRMLAQEQGCVPN